MGEEEAAAAAARVAEQARELQDAAAGLLSRSSAEEEALRRRAAALDAELARLRKAAAHVDSDKVEEDLDRATCLISDGDIAALLPSKTHGTFLKMFLGPVNLRAPRKEVQLKVKEEYNSYRDRTALLFLGFPMILLVLRSWLWNGCFPVLPVQLYQAWLLFLYTTLALRENILRVNGSDIRPWWMCHHYCAMLMSLISLTWEIKGQPDCSRKQNRYQRQRLYTRIALGKARRMDVVWGETAGVEGQLLLLCPVLFLLQGFEGYVGFLLLRTAHTGIVPEWQVVVCGVLLIAMAIGNFANTVDTLMAKSRFKAKKRSRGKRDPDTCNSPTGLSPTNSTARA
uniref:TMPIT-like protein n=1 Tax=Oryza meridionalis TaxID=40149 RepID=A0A0E0EHY2_9ORYZ